MRLLANENVPKASVDALRALSFDVAWIREDAPGSTDRAVVARAVLEDRILLTLDKDFGELAFRAGLPATSGVVLVRVSPPLADRVTALALMALRSGRPVRGMFIVAEETGLRERALPKPSP
jgi:predicted nuclease of predicted toxin-antitoxin system